MADGAQGVVGRLSVLIDAQAIPGSVKAATDQIGNEFNAGTKKIANSGKTLGQEFRKSLIAGLAVGAILFTELSKIQSGFNQIRVRTGATGESLNDLNDVARSVGTQIGSSFADVGSAVGELNTRIGSTGEELEKSSLQVLQFARLTGQSVDALSANLTRVAGDWGIASESFVDSTDKLFRATQATGVSIEQLGANLVRYGAPLRQFGFSFEQATALISQFEKEGVNTELVLGSLRIALTRMKDSVKDPMQALQEITDQIKNAGNAAIANGIAVEFFGARAGPDMAAAIREGRFEIEELYYQIAYGKDTVDEADRATQTLTKSFMQFKNQVVLAIEPLAYLVFEVFNRFLVVLTSMPNPIRQVVIGLAAFGAIAKYTNLFSGFNRILLLSGTALGSFRKQLEIFKVQTAMRTIGDPLLMAGTLDTRMVAQNMKMTRALTLNLKNVAVFSKSAASALGRYVVASTKAAWANAALSTKIGLVAAAIAGVALLTKKFVNDGDLDAYTQSMRAASANTAQFGQAAEEFAKGINTGEEFLGVLNEVIVTYGAEARVGGTVTTLLARNFTDLGKSLELAAETVGTLDSVLSNLLRQDPTAAANLFAEIVKAAEQVPGTLDEILKRMPEFELARKMLLSQTDTVGQQTIFGFAEEEASKLNLTLKEGQTWLDRFTERMGMAFDPIRSFMDARKSLEDIQTEINDLNRSLADAIAAREQIRRPSMAPRGDEEFWEARERANREYSDALKQNDEEQARLQEQIEEAKRRTFDIGLNFLLAQEALVSSLVQTISLGEDPRALIEETLSKLENVAGVAPEQIAEFRDRMEPFLSEAYDTAFERLEQTAIEEQNFIDTKNRIIAQGTDLMNQLLSVHQDEWPKIIDEAGMRFPELSGTLVNTLVDEARRFEDAARTLNPELNEGIKATLGLADAIKFLNAEATLASENLASKESPLFTMDNFWTGLKTVVDPFNLLGFRAEGGPVSSGSPYIVGEKGPELFIPRVSGTVVANDDLANTMISTNITNIYQTRELSAAQLADEVSYRQGRQLTGRQR